MSRSTLAWCLAVSCAFALGCAQGGPPSTNVDAGLDGGDAGLDAGRDAGVDAGVVVILPGPDSDGGYGNSDVCAAAADAGYSCSGTCAYTIASAAGYLGGVPAEAIGASFPCDLYAFYDLTTHVSHVVIGNVNEQAIGGTGFMVSWWPSDFQFLTGDFGTAPGITLQSGSADTHAPLVSLVFSNITNPHNPISEGFGNDWINPVVDPVHGPVQQGSWSITLSALTDPSNVGPLGNGDQVRVYRVTGTGVFNMIFDNTLTGQTANMTVNLTFTDAYQPL